MNQWTLPSQGLLSQNVEAVCRRAQVGCCPACSCPLPAWAQRWRACLVQVLHLNGQPNVLYPRCPAHWMDVVSRLSRDRLVKTCKTTKYPPLCGGYRLPLLRSITHAVTVSIFMVCGLRLVRRGVCRGWFRRFVFWLGFCRVLPICGVVRVLFRCFVFVGGVGWFFL